MDTEIVESSRHRQCKTFCFIFLFFCCSFPSPNLSDVQVHECENLLNVFDCVEWPSWRYKNVPSLRNFTTSCVQIVVIVNQCIHSTQTQLHIVQFRSKEQRRNSSLAAVFGSALISNRHSIVVNPNNKNDGRFVPFDVR